MGSQRLFSGQIRSLENLKTIQTVETSTARMPGGKKTCTYAGTNSQGNNYRSFSNGSYTYTNKGSSGETTSKYYDTGKGHTFYTSKTGGYSVHTNRNTGESTFKSKK